VAPPPHLDRSKALPAGAVAAVFVGILVLVSSARAEDSDRFRDPLDGQFDLSDWLLQRKGFLPVPIVITEPAVGYGGGAAALFFRESIGQAAQRAQETGRLAPPDIFAVAAFATENGTWGAAGGGLVTFRDDQFRWRGGVARMSANLDFFGTGGRNLPLRYNLDGWVSGQNGMMRLGSSDAWLVGRWNYLDLSSRFDQEEAVPQLGQIVRTDRASGLGVSLEVDTRDNIFTPSRGWTGSIDLTFYDPHWGSDTRLQSYRAHAFAYLPVSSSLVLGGRIDGRAANGDVPFYMLPYVDLRGVPALRLQDERTAVAETEARWNLTPRWALIGFVGAGRAWGTKTEFSQGTDTVAKGVGFRYLIARRLGMYIGIDWAWSTQDHAVYLQVGNAWR
jgi:hypothetical protein